jgi:uncharacterized membrane protein
MRSPMDKLPLIPIPILITHKAITSRKRSLAMTITWRIVAEIDTLLVSYLITGSLMWSLSIVGIESTTKTFLYYCHERAWGHILWGIFKAEAAPERSIGK